MRTGVLCAVDGPAEAPLVAALDAAGTGLQVVRRCADLTELVALVIAGVGALAVLGGSLQGTDRAAVARLREAGCRVVLLAEDGDLARCRALGAHDVLPASSAPEEVVARLRALARDLAPPRSDGQAALPPGRALAGPPSAGSPSAGSPSGGSPSAGSPSAGSPPARSPSVGSAASAAQAAAGAGEAPSGRVVAVWGPHGAPGRTTIAVNLAAELAATGDPTLLVDADTWGGCVAQALGLLDESPGLAGAARAATNGVLDPAALARFAPVVEPGLRVLTGVSRPDRWRELPAAGLDVVWQVCRGSARWTVVDCGFSLEDEAGPGFEVMLGPRRNGATLSAIAAADVVLAVGSAEPVGIQRLIQSLASLEDRTSHRQGRPQVVLNRVRASAAGPSPERAVTEALVRYAGVPDAVLVPDDRPALDRAMLGGATLRGAAPGSAARLAIADLARRLSGRPPAPRRSRVRPAWREHRAGARPRPDDVAAVAG